MNTRRIVLASTDKELGGIVEISALTLTKLNCQVTIDECGTFDDAIEHSLQVNTNLIIIDNDSGFDVVGLIALIRHDPVSKNKKIILIHTTEIDKENIFSAGCDSIMKKEEFKRVVNNLLVF